MTEERRGQDRRHVPDRRRTPDRRSHPFLDRRGRDYVRELTARWDYSKLPANVRFGADCHFESPDSFGRFTSTRDTGLVIGERVRVYSWTTFIVGPGGRMEVGDDTVLVGATFICQEEIRIGAGVTVSYNVLFADTDMHPLEPELRRLDAIHNAPEGDARRRPPIHCEPVAIQDGVSVGVGAIVLKGVTVGAEARIAPGAVVTADVPAGAEVAGNPARVIRRP